MAHSDPMTERPFEPDGATAFQPRPIRGDASFAHLLSHQRLANAEQRRAEQGLREGIDSETTQLLPLMLSLARLSARAAVEGAAR